MLYFNPYPIEYVLKLKFQFKSIFYRVMLKIEAQVPTRLLSRIKTYSSPQSRRLFWTMMSVTAANTNLTFSVSVAQVKCA